MNTAFRDGVRTLVLTKSDGGKFESKVELSKEHDYLSERKSSFGCADKMIWG